MGGGHIRPLWRLLQAAEAMWPASDEVRGAWVSEIVKSSGAGWKQIFAQRLAWAVTAVGGQEAGWNADRRTGGRKENVSALSKTQSQWSLEYDKPNK